MSVDGWNTILVLGGIRSGKSEFAESLVGAGVAVRYVATAAEPESGDDEWAARIETHRQRRPEIWTTEEIAAAPSRLIEIVSAAGPDETLLVDDLGGWVTVLLDPAHQPADDGATIGELANAVRDCAGRLVLVSSEVGLSMVPTTPLGRRFVDTLGSVNRAVAGSCDAVVLVVAGQPAWLKPAQAGRWATTPAAATSAAGQPPTPTPVSLPDVLAPVVTPPAPTAPPVPASDTAWAAPTMTLPMVATGLVIQPGMELPMPDERAAARALERLASLDIPGTGLGNLERVIGFAAGTQGTAGPEPWRSVRVLLLHGDHQGGAAAGTVPGESTRRADQARSGDGPLARLAAEIGATLQVVEAPTSAAMEDGPVLSAEAVESALRYGWRLAEEAAEDGVQVLVLAACGAGTAAASAAVLAATAGAEPAAVLDRVIDSDGRVDDAAWMVRCATVRDAMHRTRDGSRAAKGVLAELGGGDIAVATGVLLGATARRTPVLLDGPAGVAAGLISRDLAGQARHWCLLTDHGGHPAVRLAADVLGLTPLFDLRLDLGEGATALATLPLLRSALTLAAALPAHPAAAPATEPESDGPTLKAATEPGSDGPTPETADDGLEFAEPEPAGPGPGTRAADEPSTDPTAAPPGA